METQVLDIERPGEKTLKTMGDVFYLMQRSAAHRAFTLGSLRQWWEPPLHLGQVWVFNVEGVPRAAVSWAKLSPEAERRYVSRRAPLRAEDWRSGDIPWVIDWLSPYKNQTFEAMIGRWIRDTGFAEHHFRYMRLGTDGTPRRVVETHRAASGKQAFRMMRAEEFGLAPA
ncbi:MAG: toxin-activating lysine-acyltransferase [Pseudomonadota bacterium]